MYQQQARCPRVGCWLASAKHAVDQQTRRILTDDAYGPFLAMLVQFALEQTARTWTPHAMFNFCMSKAAERAFLDYVAVRSVSEPMTSEEFLGSEVAQAVDEQHTIEEGSSAEETDEQPSDNPLGHPAGDLE